MTGNLFFIDGKAYTGNKEELQRPIEDEEVEDQPKILGFF